MTHLSMDEHQNQEPSDENAEGPGRFTARDAALGTADGLVAFAGQARLLVDLPARNGLWNAFTDWIEETVANGGTIRFKLDQFNPTAALNPKSQYYDSYASNEFRYVMLYFPTRTVFYKNGSVVAAPHPTSYRFTRREYAVCNVRSR